MVHCFISGNTRCNCRHTRIPERFILPIAAAEIVIDSAELAQEEGHVGAGVIEGVTGLWFPYNFPRSFF